MAKIRGISRYREIAGTLAKYGFADFMSELGFARYLPARIRKRPRTSAEKTEVRAENFALALEDLGPTFIKMGQFLSSHAGFLPRPYLKQLERLRDEVPPFPFDDVVKLIESEFGMPLKEIFPEFSAESLASASLAQVHSAVTVDGQRVAVKVRRPGIEETIRADIEVLEGLAGFAQKRSAYGDIYDFPNLVEQFRITILEEIDFRIEAESIVSISESISEYSLVQLPRIYPELVTRQVLTLELIEGYKINQSEKLAKIPQEVKTEMARELIGAYLRQVLIEGVFHADPHPGNVLILPEGKIVLIDLGLVGRLDAVGRSAAARLLLGFAEQEAEEIVDMLLSSGSHSSPIDLTKLRDDIARIITHYQRLSVGDSRIGEGVVEIMRIASRHRLRLPSSLALLAKTLIFVGGITQVLDPKLNIADSIGGTARRYAFRMAKSRFSIPRTTLGVLEMSELAWYLPGKLRRLLSQLSHNQLGIQFKHVGLEGALKVFERTGNRLSFSIIVAAIALGSAQLISSDVGAKIFGYPAIGVVGFVMATFLGLYLVISMLFGGRWKI